MTADPFGGRRHHDVGAVFDRPYQVTAGAERIVDDQRNAVVVGDRGNGFEVRHVETGIADRLHIKRLGIFIDGAAETFRIVPVDELDTDAEPRQRHLELIVGAAIKVAGGNDVVAGLGNGLDGEELRGLAGGDGEGGHTTFERGDPFFEDVRSGIHDPRINVAKLLQSEEAGAVIRILEGVGGGLINRHGAGVGAGGRFLAGVNLQGFETVT